MAAALPKTMRSIALHTYMQPAGFELADLPIPQITSSTHVLVRVHAAAINPVDMEVAAGGFKDLATPSFPLRLGFDFSGTVVETGSEVDSVAAGDEVFGCLSATDLGSWSEFVVTTASLLVHKPKSLSHIEAASLPLVGMTTLQAFEKVPNGCVGKTVLIPAGVGGVGSIACQIAKSVYGAGRVITTVSTENVAKVDEFFDKGAVDQVIDYKKSDPLKEIPHGSVHVLLDTIGVFSGYFPLLQKNNASIVGIYGLPSGRAVKAVVPTVPFYIQLVLDILAAAKSLHAWWFGFTFSGILQRSNSSDLKKIATWVEEGKLRPVVGRIVELEDIAAVREACIQMSSSSRSVGKVVIRIK